MTENTMPNQVLKVSPEAKPQDNNNDSSNAIAKTEAKPTNKLTQE